jgi:anti-sigma factor RsiW
MWDVEKHLSACAACTAQAHQMQMTVDLLHTAAPHETGDDFMARLHARIDGLEPEMARTPSLAVRLRDWLAGVQESLRIRSTPALGMTVALCGVAALLILPLLPKGIPEQAAVAVSTSVPQPVQQELDRHIANVADDPLGDVAAAKLTTHLSPGDDNSGGELE